MLTYLVILALLLVLEVCYFKIADYFNIIDKPNERSSHSTIVLRGGGIIFAISILVWMGLQMVHGEWFLDEPSGRAERMVKDYLPFVIGLVLVCGVSFWDDVKSLPDSVRLVAQFAAMILMFYQLDMLHVDLWWAVVLALIVCVGASNIINFMDGINGITGAYAMASLIPLYLLNNGENGGFVDNSFIITMMLADVVFCFFNFRPRGKAKCFAGDVGSLGVAFILLFLIGCRVMQTGDVTYLVFLVVYGVDGVLTIWHRIMLHENLGKAHRKHAYQLMANELKMSHITVSLFYACLQLVISLIFIYLVPNTILAHCVFIIGVLLVLLIAYVLFMKKYYYLHEQYLKSIEK